MSREDAFAAATLAEASEALERLGDAATASETSISKLETKWGNFVDQLGVGIANIAEGVADIFVAADYASDHERRIQEKMTAARGRQAGEIDNSWFAKELDLFSSGLKLDDAINLGDSSALISARDDLANRIEMASARYAQMAAEADRQSARLAELQAMPVSTNIAFGGSSSTKNEYFDELVQLQGQLGQFDQITAEIEAAQAAVDSYNRAIELANESSLSGIADEASALVSDWLVLPKEAEAFVAQLEQARQEHAELVALSEQGIISKDEVENADALVKSMAEVYTEIDKVVQKVSEISFTSLLEGAAPLESQLESLFSGISGMAIGDTFMRDLTAQIQHQGGATVAAWHDDVAKPIIAQLYNQGLVADAAAAGQRLIGAYRRAIESGMTQLDSIKLAEGALGFSISDDIFTAPIQQFESEIASLVDSFNVQIQLGDWVAADQTIADIESRLANMSADNAIFDSSALDGTISGMRELADEALTAQKNINAAKNSLAVLTGTSSGGVDWQIAEQVAALLPEDQREAYLDKMALSTGRETESSRDVENILIPALAKVTEQFGADFTSGISSAITDSMTQGLSVVESLAQQGISYGADTEGGSGKYEISAGDTGYAIARELEITFKELEALNKGINWRRLIPGQEIEVPGGDGNVSYTHIPGEGGGQMPIPRVEIPPIELPDIEIPGFEGGSMPFVDVAMKQMEAISTAAAAAESMVIEPIEVQPPEVIILPFEPIELEPPILTVSDFEALEMLPPDLTVADFAALEMLPPSLTVEDFKALKMLPPDLTVEGFKALQMLAPKLTVADFEALQMLPPDLTVADFAALELLPPDLTVADFAALQMLPPDLTVADFKALELLPPDFTVADFQALELLPPSISVADFEAIRALPPEITIADFERMDLLPPGITVAEFNAIRLLPPSVTVEEFAAYRMLAPDLTVEEFAAYKMLAPDLTVEQFAAYRMLPPDLTIADFEAYRMLAPELTVEEFAAYRMLAPELTVEEFAAYKMLAPELTIAEFKAYRMLAPELTVEEFAAYKMLAPELTVEQFAAYKMLPPEITVEEFAAVTLLPPTVSIADFEAVQLLPPDLTVADFAAIQALPPDLEILPFNAVELLPPGVTIDEYQAVRLLPPSVTIADFELIRLLPPGITVEEFMAIRLPAPDYSVAPLAPLHDQPAPEFTVTPLSPLLNQPAPEFTVLPFAPIVLDAPIVEVEPFSPFELNWADVMNFPQRGVGAGSRGARGYSLGDELAEADDGYVRPSDMNPSAMFQELLSDAFGMPALESPFSGANPLVTLGNTTATATVNVDSSDADGDITRIENDLETINETDVTVEPGMDLGIWDEALLYVEQSIDAIVSKERTITFKAKFDDSDLPGGGRSRSAVPSGDPRYSGARYGRGGASAG